MLKDQIAQAATDVLINDGLENWTISAVAQEAGCAKGLVHYHHHTKIDLLGTVADRLASGRCRARIAALSAGSTAALDALWEIIARSVETGASAAWLSLLGHPNRAIRQRTVLPPDYLAQFAEAICASFALEALDESQAKAVDTAVDGLELALLRGDPEEAVHDAYHRVWLTVL